MLEADALLEFVATHGNPVIEGERVTFVWRGEHAPLLIADFTHWEQNAQAFRRVAPGLWTYSIRLPESAYIEYALWDEQRGERVVDPLNPRRCPNGLGDYNHYFYMANARPHPDTRRKASVPRGKIQRVIVETRELAATPKRAVYLYQPAEKRPEALLLVYDGVDYLRRGKITAIADNLIARGEVRPFAMVLVDHGRKARMVEYSCADITLGFVDEILLPLAHRMLDLTFRPDERRYAVLGASMGGLMALYTVLRMPALFYGAICQAGAYTIKGHDMVVYPLVGALEPAGQRIWLDVGRYDFLADTNRRMQKVLFEQGYTVYYREFNGGHNFTVWRNNLPQALTVVLNEGQG